MLSICTLNPDKFGYYQVGNYKTYSKFEALELQHQTKQFPTWNFNSTEFASAAWTREPPVDLWELYKARAQQIRNSYDYVVMLYSGGSDSHNALSAWIDADCQIDEIATQCNYAGTKDKLGFWNGEVTNVAIPFIEQLKLQGLEFKFRLIDISEDTINVIQHFDQDYRYLINTNLSPNNHARNMWRLRIQDYQDIISAGKKLCFVWGSEKPTVYWENRWYMLFQDMIDNCVGPFNQLNYSQGWFDELFYWTPDMPEISIKQGHVIRKFCETINDPKWYQRSKTRYGYNRLIDMYLTESSIKQILYPRWNPATYCDGKSPNFIISARDEWLAQGNIDSTQNFHALLNQWICKLDPYWLNDPADITKGIKGCISPRYYLEF